MFVLILTIFIEVLNFYYLFYHYRRFLLWINWDGDRLIDEMIYISRINMICLAMWFVPYGILLVREIKGDGNKIELS